MMFTAALMLALQVGPNPSALELEPLPIPRGGQAQVIAADTAPDTAPAPDPEMAARTGAIAGNQAIITGDYEDALSLLGAAQNAAQRAGNTVMAAEIRLDRARALMMLGRNAEADGELAAARAALPGHAHAWTVSAVNARRMGEYSEAQSLLAEALSFAPVDPGVRLEAGTLAYMAGDDESAIAHWQSVIDNSPGSGEAEFAAQYIASARASAAHGESGR